MKKVLKELSLFTLMILMGFLTSCDKDNGDSPDPAPKPTPEITLPDNQKEFPIITDEGRTVTLKFSSATEWTLIPNVDWIKTELASGKGGNQQVILTIQPNTTPDERTGTITVRSGNVTETITITQKQKDALTLTSKSIELGETNSNFFIEVKANIKYEVQISNEKWIHQIKSCALTTDILEFKVDANENEEERTGEIVISNGDLKETFTIRQSGKKSESPDKEPLLNVSQADFSVSAIGESISFDVESNVGYKVETGADWIQKDSEYSTGNHWEFIVQANESTHPREATITISAGGLTKTITVTQSGQEETPILNVSQTSFSVKAEGENISFEVESNIRYKVSTDANWIKQRESRAISRTLFGFTVEANESTHPREATIIISGGGLTKTISVEQSGKVEEKPDDPTQGTTEDFEEEQENW